MNKLCKVLHVVFDIQVLEIWKPDSEAFNEHPSWFRIPYVYFISWYIKISSWRSKDIPIRTLPLVPGQQCFVIQATLAMPAGLCASFDINQHICSNATHNLITSSSYQILLIKVSGIQSHIQCMFFEILWPPKIFRVNLTFTLLLKINQNMIIFTKWHHFFMF